MYVFSTSHAQLSSFRSILLYSYPHSSLPWLVCYKMRVNYVTRKFTLPTSFQYDYFCHPSLTLVKIYFIFLKIKIGETASDSASEAWKRNRKLPTQPSEEPVTPASIVKRLLLDDRFKTSSASNLYSSSIPPLRAASSLDSATHPLLSSSLTTARSTTGLGGRVSPYTGLTDVTNLINTSLGRTTPPLATTLRSGKNTSGSLLDQLRSSSRGTLPLSPISRSGSPRLTPSGFYKNMKQQLKDELKSAVEERRMLLEMNEREMADLCPPSSDTDLKALFDLYSDVPDVLLPSAALSRNLRMRNMDPYASPLPPPTQELPPGYYKSHEFQGIEPMSFGSEYRRPLSSMTGTDSIRVAGLSSLGNEELFTDPYREFSYFFSKHIFYPSYLTLSYSCFKHTTNADVLRVATVINVSIPVTCNLFYYIP